MEQGISLLLKGLGIDAASENYRETPARVTRLFQELLSPKQSNWKSFPSRYRGMVLLRNHEVYGLCPHHLQVVRMRVYIGYIPQDRAVGLSKLARAVEEHLSMPVLQEDLTDNVANSIEERLKPVGCAVVIVGKHGCMRHRGIRSKGDVITSSLRGALFNVPAAREEFMMMIGGL